MVYTILNLAYSKEHAFALRPIYIIYTV